MNVLLFTVCMMVASVAPEAPGAIDSEAFQYHAPVILEGAPQGFVRLMLTTGVIDKLNPDWGDLRLADEQNRAVPYLLRRDMLPYGPRNKPKPGVCQEMAALDDGTRAFLVDFGGPTRKNRIDLQEWMHDPWPLRIEGSADKQAWQILLDGDYRVQARMDAGGPLSRWLQLSEGDQRWLRVVYAFDKAPAVNTFASPVLADYLPTPQEAGLVPVTLTRVEPDHADTAVQQKRLVYEWTVSARNIPVALARFVVDDPYFSRQYALEASTDGKYWTVVSTGTLNRTQWEKHSVDTLTSMQGFVTQGRLRLTVNDGDNPPLSVQAPELWGRTGQLCFDAAGRKAVTLYFGNAVLAGPSYDLAQSVRDLRIGSLPEMKLGETEHRPQESPKPVEKPADSPPYLLWGIMAVAVCVMLAIVLGSMGAMTRADRKEQNAQGEDK